MAVLSIKPVNPSRDIVQALGLEPFRPHLWRQQFTTTADAAGSFKTILEETGVAAAEAIMIGDSSIDVLTGPQRLACGR